MTIGQIEDRAGGPAIVGTRITVDDVLAYLLEPSMTEEAIGRLLSLTGDEVAATRAYILRNPDYGIQSGDPLDRPRLLVPF